MQSESIQSAQRAVEDAKTHLHHVVQEARHNGRTWADIGEALDISRQAAFKRFGEVKNPADGRIIKGVTMSIERIRQLTEQVFELISTGNYQDLEQLLHPEVRAELTPALIGETWASVLTEVGAKEGFEDTHVVLPTGERIEEDQQVLGAVVGVTTLQHEAGEMMGRVAVDGDLKVGGILIVPPGHEPLAF
ncbi:MAG: hypothetical protein ACTHWM_07700 [Yaniella sp.]|uniref:hypothetical protein n=1 Tax=Yaniella sp. TaxID=2773929 RepID=UPI003F949AA4